MTIIAVVGVNEAQAKNLNCMSFYKQPQLFRKGECQRLLI